MLVKLILKRIFHKVIFTLEQYRYNVIVSKRLNEVNCPSVSMLFVSTYTTPARESDNKNSGKMSFLWAVQSQRGGTKRPDREPFFFCLCGVVVVVLHAGGRLVPGGIASPPGSGGSTGNTGNSNSAAARRGNRRLTRNESRYHSGEYITAG